MSEIELITISRSGKARSEWDLGPQQTARPDIESLAMALTTTSAEAVLCLDEHLPSPGERFLAGLIDGPADAWHGGLRLGAGGGLKTLDHVDPQWTFGLQADGDLESTSWELSIGALLVRRTVLEQLGGPDPRMRTLEGAGLELGLRWIKAGAVVRYVPGLVPTDRQTCDTVQLQDQFRVTARHYGRVWAGWALQRSVVRRTVPFRQVPELVKAIRNAERQGAVQYETPSQNTGDPTRTVSVILPTIDRYAYLEPLLSQLSAQTVPPHEVIIVDQTPAQHRRADLESIEPSLPTMVFDLDEPGQSTARNIALRNSSGEMVLFLDDDDEISETLIEEHLARLVDGIDAICGGVDDATAGPPPLGFRHRRASDVFPTNNTMLRRDALYGSGLFDPVYDRGPRADRDLGIRLHLSGALIVYDPSVMVFHHHAPIGGLRTHGARKMTRAGARKSLSKRNLPAITEIYCDLRYTDRAKVHEGQLIRFVSTLSGEGSSLRRALRMFVQLFLAPNTVRVMRTRYREAEQVLSSRPPLPRFSTGENMVAK